MKAMRGERTPMLLDRLDEQPPGSAARADRARRRRSPADKIDVGVGVYRDAAGNTPILSASRRPSSILSETQETKAYLGSQGDARFAELIRPLVFGEDAAGDDRHRRRCRRRAAAARCASARS